MTFYGWQKLSYIDYPEKLSTLLFTGGCNLRCPFCHNPELVRPSENLPQIQEEEIIAFLKKRTGLLDAVAITGGEPLFHAKELKKFLNQVKEMGFLVKMDTNGTFPERIQELSPLVDFWAMDFKVPPSKYHLLAEKDYAPKIKESLSIITTELKTPYEIRTTLYPPLVSTEALKEMSKYLKDTKIWVWQQFRSVKTLDSKAKKIPPYSHKEIVSIKSLIQKDFKGKIEVRD